MCKINCVDQHELYVELDRASHKGRAALRQFVKSLVEAKKRLQAETEMVATTCHHHHHGGHGGHVSSIDGRRESNISIEEVAMVEDTLEVMNRVQLRAEAKLETTNRILRLYDFPRKH